MSDTVMGGVISPNCLEVCVLPHLGAGGPVVFAPAAPGAQSRESLAARLMAALAGLAPEWTAAPAGGRLTLEVGPLGQPLLRLDGQAGPSLSFSESGGLVWGALSARGRVGVDAAQESEFAPPYPYARVFAGAEWEWALGHCLGSVPTAAALLWAAKEAAAKALGVGFHNLAPLDLRVASPVPGDKGLGLTVLAGEAVPVWARALEGGWLALAVVAGHGGHSSFESGVSGMETRISFL